MSVVDMRGVRDLLKDWDDLRQKILQGEIQSWMLSVQDHHGREAVYVGGRFKGDADAALRAGMRASWEKTKIEDEEQPQLTYSV